jgi:hypothetical protein
MNQLFVSNTCSKIEVLLCHINSKSNLGQIIQRNINWLQLISGLQDSILETKININYTTQTWFHPIKEYLNTINAT